MNKVSEAQKKASRKYEELNREKTRINNYRRTARLFVKSYATEEDMQELIRIYNENKKSWFYSKRNVKKKVTQILGYPAMKNKTCSSRFSTVRKLSIV